MIRRPRLERARPAVYIVGIYHGIAAMRGVTTAKLFTNGRSQAVRLPREFRFQGNEVRIRRVGRGVLLEPIDFDLAQWFAELDRFAEEPFMPDGRDQPPTPIRDIFE